MDHGGDFVRAFGQGHLQVQSVRAAVHLLARQAEHAVVIIFQYHLLEIAATLRVQPFPDQERSGFLWDGLRLDG